MLNTGDYPFTGPAGHTVSHTSQDTTGHLKTLLAHTQPAVDQQHQVLFRSAAFQQHFHKLAVLDGVVVAEVQDPTFYIVETYTIDLDLQIQPAQNPLKTLPILQQINILPRLGVICEPTEGALHFLTQIINKGIKQDWLQH